jgi:hypothetical protein
MATPAPSDAARIAAQVEVVRNLLLRLCAVLTGLLQAFFGMILLVLGLQTLRQWDGLSTSLAVITVLWLIAAPVVLVSGVWSLVSLGRYRLPLWTGGSALLAAGGALVAGVLTHFIPCAGPT